MILWLSFRLKIWSLEKCKFWSLEQIFKSLFHLKNKSFDHFNFNLLIISRTSRYTLVWQIVQVNKKHIISSYMWHGFSCWVQLSTIYVHFSESILQVKVALRSSLATIKSKVSYFLSFHSQYSLSLQISGCVILGLIVRLKVKPSLLSCVGHKLTNQKQITRFRLSLRMTSTGCSLFYFFEPCYI